MANPFTPHMAGMARVTVAIAMERARKSSGFKQGEFANLMGLSQAHISRIEAGMMDVSISNLTMWAHLCGCKVADLVDGL